MKYTENYNLKKPDKTDLFNIENENENMDILDSLFTEQKNEINSKGAVIGSNNDVDSEQNEAILSETGPKPADYFVSGNTNSLKRSSSTVRSVDRSAILGGKNNQIYQNTDSAIIGGRYNEINNAIFSNSMNTNNVIVGGYNNKLGDSSGAMYGFPTNCTIIGGKNNLIKNTSGIANISGVDNIMSSTGNGYVTMSGIGNQVMSGYNESAVSIFGKSCYASSFGSGTLSIFGDGIGTSNPTVPGLMITGKYSKEPTSSDIFIVGNGSSGSRSNGMRLTTSGYLYYGTGCGAGSDYAEFFEWSDGNPNNEDRCGVFVTFDFDKEYQYDTTQELPCIRIAHPGDYILGVISGNPSFVGNSDEEWKKRWLYDEFDRPVFEIVQVPDTELQEVETGEYYTDIQYDENDNEVEVQLPVTQLKEVETGTFHTEYQQVVNPEYDENMVYKSRFDRKEWEAAGMLGVLSVKDDGSCKVGEFCKCGKDGVATLADKRDIDTFLVLRRVSDNIVKIVFK